jgi:hypothetical protein
MKQQIFSFSGEGERHVHPTIPGGPTRRKKIQLCKAEDRRRKKNELVLVDEKGERGSVD